MGTYFLDASHHMWTWVYLSCQNIFIRMCFFFPPSSGSSPARVLSKRPMSTEEGVLSPVSESPPSKVSVLNTCVMCVMFECRIACGGILAYVLHVLVYIEIVFSLCGV